MTEYESSELGRTLHLSYDFDTHKLVIRVNVAGEEILRQRVSLEPPEACDCFLFAANNEQWSLVLGPPGGSSAVHLTAEEGRAIAETFGLAVEDDASLDPRLH